MITVKNLSYIYRTIIPHVIALKHIDLCVAEGELLAIQGPSGSGKSTLLHILGCMLPYQCGEISIDDLDITKLTPTQLALVRNQKLGFIFQQPYLLSRADILANILLPTQYPCELFYQKADDKKKALEYAERLGISHRLHHLPDKLSGGEAQRVVIARSLIRGAKILFADEPTGDLDSKRSQQIIDHLKLLQRDENLTIVLITHNPEIAKHADRIAYLHDGRIIEEKVNRQIAPAEKSNKILEQKKLDRMQNLLLLQKHFKAKCHGFFRLIPIALKNMWRNKTRSILTMFGIVIGISALLTTITLGNYTRDKILASYNKLGANTLAIYGFPNWQMMGTIREISLLFSAFSIENDLKPLPKIFPQINMISPVITLWGARVRASYSGKTLKENIALFGVSEDFTTITERKIMIGRSLRSYDIAQANSVCVIGYEIMKLLFGEQSPVDATINLQVEKNYHPCIVKGVLERVTAASFEGFDQNLQILVPYSAFYKISGNVPHDKTWRFLTKIRNAEDVPKVGNAINKYFATKYGESGRFSIDPNILLLSQLRKFFNLFAIMLTFVAMLTLVVAGIGITNMMLASIDEQFKEIGLKKAVGATDTNMKIQFLIESVSICCIAGLIGLLLGFAVYEGVIYAASKIVAELPFEWLFSPMAIGLATASMFAVGMISGIEPASKAESLDIITTLRS